MTADRRSDRHDLDALTQDYLAKGGKIVQCPPGPSEQVVYKRNTFKRRAAPKDKEEAAAAPPPAGD